ncbi:hypothetical protein SAMN06265171_10563 [Chryseobacterium rhizoplanae]|uniref:ATP-grasp domain-containing protein n=1 Tax=Chryseobacterium rhizoplanae TaxID=1609531 RepID=A0A521DFH5_9FLAO|nr:hypothetical protein [Chryseobacterium rhizoplanae]SMO70356.1 hypothetical protein SAMN06265171_10563 [Chryseobacterium rhizoplanae]
MILILTDQHDVHANILIDQLKQDKATYFRLNLDVNSLEKTHVKFDGTTWHIQTTDGKIDLRAVEKVWNRKTFVQLMLEEQNKGYEFNIWKNEWNKTLLGIYYFLSEKKWLNYYRENHKAENKYLQMAVAKKIGFNLPKFLLSNKKNEILQFASSNNKIVMKLMNQDFYEVEKGKFKGFYVNTISKDDFNDFNENEENPIFLQEYIEKKYEIRYTVVGNEHFVCKIESQKSEIAKTDWRRYDLANTPHHRISPPAVIQDQVNQLMKNLNLNYGALDFIVDEKDQWWFLEINPGGQYLWIEDLTGMPITSSIKKFLLN